MERGEIWRVALPLVTTREQGGERPALILQDGIKGQASPLILIAPLTSQIAALRFPATVRIDPTPENGLTLPSVAMGFQTRALDRTRFIRLIGAVEATTLDALLVEMDSLMGR